MKSKPLVKNIGRQKGSRQVVFLHQDFGQGKVVLGQTVYVVIPDPVAKRVFARKNTGMRWKGDRLDAKGFFE